MTTRIRDVQEADIPFRLATRQTWLDAWSYVDLNGEAIPLDGIVFTMWVRETPDSDALLVISNGTAPAGETLDGTFAVSGGTIGLNDVALTGQLEPGTYCHVIQAVADGITVIVADGRVIVEEKGNA